MKTLKTFRLVIKGTPDEARKAALRHLISFDVERTVNDVTVGYTTTEERIVQSWFLEPQDLIQGIGYPAGTLLLYTHGRRQSQ